MAKKEATTCPLTSAREAARICEFTPQWLRQLERENYFQKRGRNKYDVIEVLKGHIRYLQDDARRSSKTEAVKRTQDARAREIELRIAREEGRSISIEDVAAGITEIMGALRSEFSGIAAASTRDLAMREVIDGHLNGAIERSRHRFEAMEGGIRAGGGVPLDGEETDA